MCKVCHDLGLYVMLCVMSHMRLPVDSVLVVVETGLGPKRLCTYAGLTKELGPIHLRRNEVCGVPVGGWLFSFHTTKVSKLCLCISKHSPGVKRVT